MKALVAVTDSDWYRFLRSRPDLEEANFWQPSGSTEFKALTAGEPMLFKLHAPDHFIVGGGFFAHFSRLPYRTAWEFFGEANGAPSLQQMRQRIEKYRRAETDPFEDYYIGCIILTGLFFFEEAEWIPVPSDWSPNIVRYKGYPLHEPVGQRLWEEVRLRLHPGGLDAPLAAAAGQMSIPGGPRPQTPPADIYGEPTLVRPRLGQGAFRALITDTYERRCSVSGEKALPALEAAHIRPVSEGGLHQVDNGLLLRSDIHRLYDRGYVTVDPDYRFHVSRRLKTDFENGEPYYGYENREIWRPQPDWQRPSKEFLEWHSDSVFRG